MSYRMDYAGIQKALKTAEDISEQVKQKRLKYDPVKLTPGARYLLQHMIRPILDGEIVSAAALDMDAFNQEDIPIIYQYYTDHCLDRFDYYQKLVLMALVENIRYALPKATPVLFV